jgi:Tfp pilus assembly protein PilF
MTRTLLLAMMILGCATGGTLPADLRLPPVAASARPHLQAGLEALWAGAWIEANLALNHGLEIAPRDPHLHFLNGYAYELRAEDGAQDQAELAEVGYRLALKFDPHHWAAAYRLGRLLWRQGRTAEARDAFARAVSAAPDRAEPAYALAVGAYALADPRTAAWALKQLPDAQAQAPQTLRAKALVQAALGAHAEAEALAEAYGAAGGASGAAIARRLHTWKVAHDRVRARKRAGGATTRTQTQPTSPKASAVKQVVFDAVIVSQEESASSQYGINLLSALTLQFEGTLLNMTRSVSRDVTTGAVQSFTDSENSGLQIGLPQVKYSLNIANASDSSNQIVARPSVIAHDGETSEVFIGSEVTYIATGGFNGTSQSKEVGITLNVRPKFLPDGRLRVAVRTQFGAFLPTSAPGSFDQAVATIKNRSAVTVEMAFGQTLALAAGTSTRRSSVRSGVPILREIPILQMLFSTTSETEQEASVVVLLTPRRPPAPNASGPAAAALQAHYGDFVHPNLATLDRFAGGTVRQEFRRGDLAFIHPDGPSSASRARTFLNDVLETLYL